MIYVTLGTMFMDFPRLIRKMDEMAGRTGERVVIQLGLSKILPKHAEYFDFKPHEEILEIQREARVIVCHAGIGAVRDALSAARPMIVVPRLKRFGEHMNDHQLDLAEAVAHRGWGRMVMDIDDLDDACANPPLPPLRYRPAREGLIAAVRNMIARIAEEKARCSK